MRINGADSLLPGAGRSNEISVWKAASKQGIAPALIFVEPQNQYLVSAYINNDLPSQPPFIPGYIDQAIELLQRCHRLDVDALNINYLEHIEHYWQIIEARKSPLDPVLCQQRKPMQINLESLINSKTPTGLCHHDPVAANFVGTPNRLYLIDWEYAATGLQIMDYAALAIEWKIDDQTILERTKFKPELLTRAKALYKYLCLLWEEATKCSDY